MIHNAFDAVNQFLFAANNTEKLFQKLFEIDQILMHYNKVLQKAFFKYSFVE